MSDVSYRYCVLQCGDVKEFIAYQLTCKMIARIDNVATHPSYNELM